MFVTFVLIFKFILIYLLHELFVLKIKGIFEKNSPTQECAEMGSFLYIYSINLSISILYTNANVLQ